MHLPKWSYCLALAGLIATIAGVGGAAAFCVISGAAGEGGAREVPRIQGTSTTGHTVNVWWSLHINDARGTLQDFCLQWREYDEAHSGLSDYDGGSGPWQEDLERCTGSAEMRGRVSVNECETLYCQIRVKGVYKTNVGSLDWRRCSEWHTQWSGSATATIPFNQNSTTRSGNSWPE